MGMTEHEAILQLKDITQVFQAEDREEVDQMFYNQLTLEDIRENLQEFNCVIGEIKQILLFNFKSNFNFRIHFRFQK